LDKFQQLENTANSTQDTNSMRLLSKIGKKYLKIGKIKKK